MSDIKMFDDGSDNTTENIIVDQPSGPVYSFVDLPSKGLLGYPARFEYRDILLKDEKTLASATEKNYFDTLNKVLKGLLKPEYQSYYDVLSVHDRDFLLLWMWANNYSSEKTMGIRCWNCDHEMKKVIDLTKLPVTELNGDEYSHPFALPLSDGDTIIRHTTVSDASVAMKFAEKNTDYDMDTILSVMSIEFSKVMPLSEKLKYAEEHLTGKDSALIRGWHQRFRFGVDEKVEHTCENQRCEEVITTSIPFRPDWLRPSLQDGLDEIIRANKMARSQSD